MTRNKYNADRQFLFAVTPLFASQRIPVRRALGGRLPSKLVEIGHRQVQSDAPMADSLAEITVGTGPRDWCRIWSIAASAEQGSCFRRLLPGSHTLRAPWSADPGSTSRSSGDAADARRARSWATAARSLRSGGPQHDAFHVDKKLLAPRLLLLHRVLGAGKRCAGSTWWCCDLRCLHLRAGRACSDRLISISLDPLSTQRQKLCLPAQTPWRGWIGAKVGRPPPNEARRCPYAGA